MFDEFFYLLRQYGLDVSTTEWLTVQQALSLGLHRSSLTGFYDLCRAVLCKSESEYDKFDQAFEEFFLRRLLHCHRQAAGRPARGRPSHAPAPQPA